jgi:signal transduction histidine kinase
MAGVLGASMLRLAEPRAFAISATLTGEAFFLLAAVALLIRPEQPLGPGGLRVAVFEWAMILLGGGFLLLYFAVLPAGDSGYPWRVVFVLLEAPPALLAVALAVSVREEPFRGVYRILAAGFAGGALVGVLGRWAHGVGGDTLYSWADLQWLLPSLAIGAASLCSRGAVGLRPHAAPDGGRAWMAIAAVGLPPAVDLLMRALAWQPQLAEARSNLTLLTAALLFALVSGRLRRGALAGLPPAPTPASAPGGADPGSEPSEFLQLASGVAHELNNPLMAVAGWAELAGRREGSPRVIEELLAAVRRAADGVARLQSLARGANTDDPT